MLSIKMQFNAVIRIYRDSTVIYKEKMGLLDDDDYYKTTIVMAETPGSGSHTYYIKFTGLQVDKLFGTKNVL